DFKEWGLAGAQFDEMHQAAVLEPRIFRTMPALPGAAETLWRLSDAGVWIRIITHRLYVNWGHATAVADTVDWLDPRGIPSRDPCFLGATSRGGARAPHRSRPGGKRRLRHGGRPAVKPGRPRPPGRRLARGRGPRGGPGHR